MIALIVRDCYICGVVCPSIPDPDGFNEPYWRQTLDGSLIGPKQITSQTVFFCGPECSLKFHNINKNDSPSRIP